MTPSKEQGDFKLTLAVAELCAEDGAWGEGYTLLLQGFFYARRCAIHGEPWAVHLLRLYRQALDAYVTRHCVLADPSPCARPPGGRKLTPPTTGQHRCDPADGPPETHARCMALWERSREARRRAGVIQGKVRILLERSASLRARVPRR